MMERSKDWIKSILWQDVPMFIYLVHQEESLLKEKHGGS